MRLERMKLIPLVGYLLALWLIPVIVIRYFLGSWESSGHVGDSFGLTNSLFSGIALLGVLYTVRQQYEDSKRRDESLRAEQNSLSIAQETAVRQIIQLSLATELQSVRALIGENRRAIVELYPAIREVPTSPILLEKFRVQIAGDSVLTPDPKLAEVCRLIDELLVLQREILEIRRQVASKQN